MVNTASHSARSPISSATLIPWVCSASALARVRFHAVTLYPERARRVASGAPMRPVPIHPTDRLDRAEAIGTSLDDRPIVDGERPPTKGKGWRKLLRPDQDSAAHGHKGSRCKVSAIQSPARGW